jgi:hypothetical protein
LANPTESGFLRAEASDILENRGDSGDIVVYHADPDQIRSSGALRDMMAATTFKSCLLAAALLATPSFAAVGEDAGEYTFTVLKDGAPVGQHRFEFDRAGDRIEIEEATEIKVSFAMIPLYTFEHRASETWENGRALRIDSTTNDNGEQFDITVRPDGHGYIRTVNGRVDKFDGSMRVLGFWDKETLKHHEFFSTVEDKTLNVSFQRIGWETITVAGKELDAEHYRMVGDEDRDLWFDRDGHLARAEFRRLGSDIAYVRDQLAPLRPVPARSCTTAC